MNVIIAGGGVMGLSCAWRLSAAGARVSLFDARACGQGATLASLGVLRPASPFATRPLQRFHHASIDQFEAFVSQLQAASGISIRFRRIGHLELLNSHHTLDRAVARAAQANKIWLPTPDGLSCQEMLSPAQLQSRFPMLAANQYGALLCRTTAHINPGDLVSALKTACLRAGATIHEYTPILKLGRHHSRITAVRITNAVVAADAVLITAGPWTPQFYPLSDALAPLTPVKGQAVAVPALTPPLPHILKSRTTYIIPKPDEWLIGATTEPEAGFDEGSTAFAAESLLQGAAAILPALRNAPIIRHWSGLRADTPDHLPLMGPVPSLPGLYLCCGHYKTGIASAPRASELLTEAILTQKIPASLEPFLPRA